MFRHSLLGFPWDPPGIPLGFPWDSPGIQDYFGACRAGVFQQDGFMASEEMVEHLLSADPGGLAVDSPWTRRGSKGIWIFMEKTWKDHDLQWFSRISPEIIQHYIYIIYIYYIKICRRFIPIHFYGFEFGKRCWSKYAVGVWFGREVVIKQDLSQLSWGFPWLLQAEEWISTRRIWVTQLVHLDGLRVTKCDVSWSAGGGSFPGWISCAAILFQLLPAAW